MIIRYFNELYFAFIFAFISITVGLYLLLRHRSDKTKKMVLFCLVSFNLALHFLKLLFPPYVNNPTLAVRDVWFINICAINVLTFPFIFIGKSDTLKDFMFYLGILSGSLAMFLPTEAINKVVTISTFRFYICHMLIFIVPCLMVALKVHKLNYKRIWKMPFCVLGVLLLVICNQVLQSELGYVPLRGDDILEITYKNTSFIWGPTDDLAKLFTWLTPDFMKVVPFGEFAGQPKYWPFFYLVPGAFFYFLIIPFILCLPWEFKHIKSDIVKLFSKKKKFSNENLIAS